MASLFIFGVEDTSAPRSVDIASPVDAGFGAEVIVKDLSGGASSNAITITPAAGLIDGAADYTIDADNGVVHMKSDGREWIVIATNGGGGSSPTEAPITLQPIQTLSARVATAANLPTHTASGGPGVGLTLTASGNGALTVDDVAVSSGDVILYKDGSNTTQKKQHGLYTVTDPGDDTHPFILVRSTDWDNAATNALDGTVVAVTEGTVNAGLNFVNRFSGGSLTFGTTQIFWDQIADPPTLQLKTGLSRFPGSLSVYNELSIEKLFTSAVVNIDVVGQSVSINGTMVLNGATGAAQGSAIADATDAPSVITQLNLLLAYLRLRGDIAA